MALKVALVLWGLPALLLILAAGGYLFLIRGPLPRTEGRILIPGLQGQVTVYRDPWGVPHIYASSEHDLFMAQGFVQAQDRLWQMDVNRRLAAGRLSEVFGERSVEVDRLIRTFGLMRAAEAELASYDAHTREMLDHFSAGVNAFIRLQGANLPLEFRLTGSRPEPWRPEDSVAWGKFMAFQGAANWQEEIVRSLLAQVVGEGRARDLLRRIHPGGRSNSPGGPSPASHPPPRPASAARLPSVGGSNSWVVHGARTVTGLPLLANDMHLSLLVPSVWYEMHLCGGGLDVIGLSMPGAPLIVAGHNQEVAWGITFAYTDVQDLFLERLHPDEEGRYLHRGEWQESGVVEEEIRVRGREAPLRQTVRVTRHGPILPPAATGDLGPGAAYSLRWSGHDPGHMVPVLYRINRADGWETFLDAAREWSEPAVNLLYADRRGNIGYVLGSRIPIRAQGHGQGPFAGWTGEDEWLGYLEPGEKPFFLNPPEGLLVTANNDVVGPGFPHYLSEDYAPGDRAARIRQFLQGKEKVSTEDFRRLQGDYACLYARETIERLSLVETLEPDARDLMGRLRAWDGSFPPGSTEAAIFAVLSQRLLENTFRDDLGPLADLFFGAGLNGLEPLHRFLLHSRVILLDLLSEPASPWFDDVRTPERETLEDVLEKSLQETNLYLKERLGPDPASWRWGRLHTLEMEHPLGRVRFLDRLFNLGPYEGGGHLCSVWQSAVMPGMDFRADGWGVSNRHIFDLQDWDRSLGMIVPGQSGVVGSAHYSDQVGLWLEAAHHPLFYTRARVEAEAVHTLILMPSPLP